MPFTWPGIDKKIFSSSFFVVVLIFIERIRHKPGRMLRLVFLPLNEKQMPEANLQGATEGFDNVEIEGRGTR